MNISFSGIRNTSCVVERDDADSNITTRYLNTQLKDDENGNDLMDYKKLISNHKTFQNPYYSNFVNIACISNSGANVFMLNGHIIPETDEYLPLFSFIAKLTEKITNAPEKTFVNDRNYLLSNYADYALLLDRKLSTELKTPVANYLDKVHNPKSIKLCAKRINKSIQDTMVNYFA